MKAKVFALGALAMMLGVASVLAAPDRAGRWDIGLVTGGAFNDKSAIDDTGYLGANVSYGVTPEIAVGVEGGWQEAGTNADNEESIGVGNIMGDVIYRVPTVQGAFVPYAVLGLGLAGTYVTNEDGTGPKEGADDYDTSFAWKLGGGVDWFFQTDWALNLELAYTDTRPSLPRASVRSSSYWTLTGGIKRIF